jgi:hypothetical protein
MAGDGEQSSLETTVDKMLTTLTDLTAKVSNLATQTAALKPLLPLAKQLDGLPDKVTTLQAAAFEGSNQIAALSLTISHLEKAQRGDKEPSEVDAAGGGLPPYRSARRHTFLTGTQMTTTPGILASTLAPASNFRRSMARRIPFPG